MRKSIYLIFIIAALFSACNKYLPDCCGANPPTQSELSAQRNNTAYKTKQMTVSFKDDSVTLSGSGQPGMLGTNVVLDSIYIRFKYTDTGSYDVKNIKIGYETVVGPDAVVEPNSVITWYTLNTAETNTFRVDVYDSTNNWMAGNFEFHFSAGGQPDVSFLNGSFYAYFKK